MKEGSVDILFVVSGEIREGNSLVRTSTLARIAAYMAFRKNIPFEKMPLTVVTGATCPFSIPAAALMRQQIELGMESDEERESVLYDTTMAFDSYTDCDALVTLLKSRGIEPKQVKTLTIFTDALHFRRYICPLRRRGFRGKIVNQAVTARKLSQAGRVAETIFYWLSIIDPIGSNPVSKMIRKGRARPKK